MLDHDTTMLVVVILRTQTQIYQSQIFRRLSFLKEESSCMEDIEYISYSLISVCFGKHIVNILHNYLITQEKCNNLQKKIKVETRDFQTIDRPK